MVKGVRIGDIVNDLLIASKDIPDDDKGKLLVVEKKIAVKKGTLDRLLDYKDPEEIFNLIEPVLSLK